MPIRSEPPVESDQREDPKLVIEPGAVVSSIPGDSGKVLPVGQVLNPDEEKNVLLTNPEGVVGAHIESQIVGRPLGVDTAEVENGASLRL